MARSVLSRIALALLSLAIAAHPASAADEVRAIDPNAALVPAQSQAAPPPLVEPSASRSGAGMSEVDINSDLASANPTATPVDPAMSAAATDPAAALDRPGTYQKDDVLGAAEGVFGKGAQGLAEIVEKILKDQGEPNAYIAGREASAALVVGLRYGSGTLSHTIEGQRPVYWTGPSIGFDVGGDATKTFVLVYNLYDSQDLYKRYPQVEGRAYFVGGFSATYLRRGDVALIPIRLGVGVRLGANIGYMKFSEKSRWVPF